MVASSFLLLFLLAHHLCLANCSHSSFSLFKPFTYTLLLSQYLNRIISTFSLVFSKTAAAAAAKILGIFHRMRRCLFSFCTPNQPRSFGKAVAVVANTTPLSHLMGSIDDRRSPLDFSSAGGGGDRWSRLSLFLQVQTSIKSG